MVLVCHSETAGQRMYLPLAPKAPQESLRCSCSCSVLFGCRCLLTPTGGLSAASYGRTFCRLLLEDFLPPPTGGLSAASYWRTCCRLIRRLLLEVLRSFTHCRPLLEDCPPGYGHPTGGLSAASYWRTFCRLIRRLLLEVLRSFTHCRPLLEDCPPGYGHPTGGLSAASYWEDFLPPDTSSPRSCAVLLTDIAIALSAITL
jgi:hypothetical protein